MALTPPGINVQQQQQVISALKLNAAATLVSALIAATGRTHSPSEAAGLAQTIQYALFPNPGRGSHKTLMEEAEKVHA